MFYNTLLMIVLQEALNCIKQEQGSEFEMIYYNTENKNRHKRYTTCDDMVE